MLHTFLSRALDFRICAHRARIPFFFQYLFTSSSIRASKKSSLKSIWFSWLHLYLTERKSNAHIYSFHRCGYWYFFMTPTELVFYDRKHDSWRCHRIMYVFMCREVKAWAWDGLHLSYPKDLSWSTSNFNFYRNEAWS